jgi:cyclohexanone monooxygenase
VRVAIIGSGFGGLCMAIRLKQAGVEDFTLFERGERLGGTWRDNTYPGAACDVPSHLYSFSFAPKPDWTRRFAEQPEILAYLEDCADRFDVRRHIRFGVAITEARFDEAAGAWRLLAADGSVHSARSLVAATGQLNRPAVPALPGLDRFAGATFHSARWDHAHPLEGKRVAVVGTGASAIQFVPEVARRAARLTLFQRTPPWILPKPDRAYHPVEKRLFAALPGLDRAYRAWLYWTSEVRFVALRRDSRANRLVTRLARGHLERTVEDPALRARLLPDYPIGCKRVLISNDYYDALARDHVTLVTAPIAEVREDGLATGDGAFHPAEVIIFGTGFRSTEFLAPLRVTGLSGRTLDEAWRGGAEAYLGITVAGFPNLFLLYGPNTNLAHNSIIFMLESQVGYVLSALRLLDEERLRYLDLRRERLGAFTGEVQARLERSVWAAGCTSWYLDARGHNSNNWPGFTVEYRRRTARLASDDYRLAPAEDERVPAAPGRREAVARRVLSTALRRVVRPALRLPLAWQRRLLDAAARLSRLPGDVHVAPEVLGGVPGERHTPLAREGTVLYLHGGAFVAGSPRSHRNLAARLARASAATVHVPDYRLAPEHAYPAPLDDALAAYRALIAAGHDPARLALAGDSAGASLALSTALALGPAGLPPPAALVLISPFVDYTLSGRSHQSHARRDPMLRRGWLAQGLAAHRAPFSPLERPLPGLPPLLVQVGSEEILLDDAFALVARARAAGVAARLERYEGLWHDFQLNAGTLPTADRALAAIGRFLLAAWAESDFGDVATSRPG